MAESRPLLLCDTCKDGNKSLNAVAICKECKEVYCYNCLSKHKVLPATKDHILIQILKTEKETYAETVMPKCDVCALTVEDIKEAEYICKECRELYCDSCKQHHLTLKATNNHVILEIATVSKMAQVSEEMTQNVPVNSTKLSSEFEGLRISTDRELILGAQTPVLQSNGTQGAGVSALSETDRDSLSAKYIATLSGNLFSDKKECDFTGIVYLSDGRIALLDRRNKNLKMFDRHFKNISMVHTKEPCWGMTKVSDDTVAVVGGKEVLFYSIKCDRLILEDKTFQLEGEGFGISFNGTFYAVSCDSLEPTKGWITILSKDGEEVKKIDEFENMPFQFVHIGSDENDIYISSITTNLLSVISFEGELKWEKRVEGLQDIIKFHNCVMVSTGTMDEIILFTKDGTYKRTIIKNEKKMGEAVYMAYNSDKQQLYVTRRYSRIITVLQLTF